MVELLAQCAGIFVVLAQVHFIADWIFQSHYEAAEKASNLRARAWHCVKYIAVFAPLLLTLGLPTKEYVFALAWLLVAHFAVDSGVPVFLWVKRVRRPREFRDRLIVDFKNKETRFRTEEECMTVFTNTPSGAVLVTIVDQIIHLMCLWPVAGLLMTVK